MQSGAKRGRDRAIRGGPAGVSTSLEVVAIANQGFLETYRLEFLEEAPGRGSSGDVGGCGRGKPEAQPAASLYLLARRSFEEKQEGRRDGQRDMVGAKNGAPADCGSSRNWAQKERSLAGIRFRRPCSGLFRDQGAESAGRLVAFEGLANAEIGAGTSAGRREDNARHAPRRYLGEGA